MRRTLTIAALAVACSIGSAATAHADVRLTPFAGVTFGDDAPASKFNTGLGISFMGRVAGFEVDFGYTPDFYDEETDFELVGDGNVTTLFGNVVIGASSGRVQPYGVFGAGLIRSRVGDAGDLFDDVTTNDFGISAGGGVNFMVSDRVGIRGDIRYFRALHDNEPADNDLDLAVGSFGFWRTTGGVTFRF
ncbi:MAG TPA: outer membrane beta-barrel protein [Vicinamibacterales bacterium]|nr:outer membrane beta-barrel protein [Vicinamibacterales bacterium]